MKLSKITEEKILERGWITPDELINRFSPFIQDFDVKLTRGAEIRRDLIMSRIDNFRAELISWCEKNLELEEKRVQSSDSGWFSREKQRIQNSGERQVDSQVLNEREMLGKGESVLDNRTGLRQDGGEDAELADWTTSCGLGKV